jgi:membrane fusion protein, copper/silver efflux system
MKMFDTIMSNKKVVLLIVIAFFVGFAIRGISFQTSSKSTPDTSTTAENGTIQEWTCAMHPQIRQPKPGRCPICGMELVPVKKESADSTLAPNQVQLSSRSVKLAEIQVTPVERRYVENEIRMVGKVEYDETRVKDITAWIPGRIDKLYINFVGTTVKRGESLASMYSPELFSAQEELIQSIKSSEELKDSPLTSIRETAVRTVESSREKLKLLGLTQQQIEKIETSEKPEDHITVFSPLEGVILERNAFEGMYVDTGMKLYSIADLSTVWVKLDVYESDIKWIKQGGKTTFTSNAYPGETFTGSIAFIDPIVNNETRTVKVRVNVPNPGNKLKPDMFVHSIVRTGVGMPESAAGSTPAMSKKMKVNPLVIPASAPLITGKRAVVYVAVHGKEATYEGREIVLGPRAGDYYTVESGLHEGELVVVNGAFKIDSSVQILAGPSMMNPEGGVTTPVHGGHGGMPPAQGTMVSPQKSGHEGHSTSMSDTTDKKTSEQPSMQSMQPAEKEKVSGDVPQKFKEQLDSIFKDYVMIQQALSKDSLPQAKKNAENLIKNLSQIDMKLLSGDLHMAWMDELGSIKKTSQEISSSSDIEKARKSFITLSSALIKVAKKFGTSGKTTLYVFHCPMVNPPEGADWFQNNPTVANPFLGSSMPTCGELKETIPQTKMPQGK